MSNLPLGQGKLIQQVRYKWSRKQQPTPVFLPGTSHEQGILMGYRSWGRKESDTTEQLSMQGISGELYSHLTVIP